MSIPPFALKPSKTAAELCNGVTNLITSLQKLINNMSNY